MRAFAICLLAGPAMAGPAEVPPAGFAGAQYVDSAGCVFGRDGAGGWQPRQTRDGQPLCGYAPSLAPAPGPRARAEAPPVRIAEARSIPGALTSCPNLPVTAQRYLLSDGRSVMRCASERGDPAGFINGAGVPGLSVAGGPAPALLDLALRAPLDLPERRPVPAQKKAPAKGESFVQIGAFGDSANAQKVKARIRALGLPVAVSTVKRGGKTLELIFSGPFGAEDAACAVETLRANGFREVFIR